MGFAQLGAGSLLTKTAAWRDCFNMKKVDFGGEKGDFIARRKQLLRMIENLWNKQS